MNSAGKCCVAGCPNTRERCPAGTEFYSFTISDNLCPQQRSLWIEAICNRSLNGANWLPDDSSEICAEHFVGNKKSESLDNLSFVPSIFPSADVAVSANVADSEDGSDMATNCSDSGRCRNMNNSSHPMSTRHIASSPCDMCLRTRANMDEETCLLREAFRQLARTICPALIVHSSELCIQGTVGVTVDGGARVILVHFADRVCKATDGQSERDIKLFGSMSLPSDQHGTAGTPVTDVASLLEVPRKLDVEAVATVNAATSENTAVPLSYPLINKSSVNDDYAGRSLHDCVTTAWHQESVEKLPATFSQEHSHITKEKNELVSSKFEVAADLPAGQLVQQGKNNQTQPQRTLLRELLCSPLPPKRPRKTVIVPSSSDGGSGAVKIGEVVHRGRSTANSTVLGELLKTGSNRYVSEFHPVISGFRSLAPSATSAQPRHDSVMGLQGGGRGYIGRRRGYPRRGMPPKRGGTVAAHAGTEYPPSLPSLDSTTWTTETFGHDVASFPGSCPALSCRTACASPAVTDYHYSRLLHCLVEKRSCSSTNSSDVVTDGAETTKSELDHNVPESNSLSVVVKDEVVDPSYGSSCS
jgi:hypothetical protein